ncbi:MAG: class I SAM-dependent methyltransferase [Acidimicrobiia bacterium]
MGSSEVQGELWSRAAEDWAALQEAQHAPLFETMLDAADVGSSTRVLDVGCGGGVACELAAGRGAVVSGLDASPALIDLARRRVPSGDFRVGDLESLPFADGSFDAVIAANSIQYAEDRVAALRELGRVSTPDARIVVSLFGDPDRVDFRVVFAAFRDSLPEPPPGDGPFGLSAHGALEDLIEQAGLNVLDKGEVEHSFVYPDTEVFWRGAVAGGPTQAARDVVSDDILKEAVLRAAEPYMTAAGGIQLDNVFQYVIATPSL